MATLKVRYLVEKPGEGGIPRFYWQPRRDLISQGWLPRRLRRADGSPIADRTEAAAAAEILNRDLDAWREGTISTAELRAQIRAGSVAALIRDYKASKDFKKLAVKTQSFYGWCLRIIEAEMGEGPARAITPAAVRAFKERHERTQAKGADGKLVWKDTPAKANALIRTLQALLSYGRRHDYGIVVNPADRQKLSDTSEKGLIWSPEAIATFVRTADAMGWYSVGTAVMLDEWLGQRITDVLTIGRNVYRDGALFFVQSKRKRSVALPIDMVPKLFARLDEQLARQDKAKVTATTLLVCESTGRAWTEDYFRHVVAEIRAEAAKELLEIAELKFRFLRHTAITRLFEAGAEERWIAAVSGHSLKTVHQILDRYSVSTLRMARQAFQKRLDQEQS